MTKISLLQQAADLNGEEQIPIVQDGVSRRLSVQSFAERIANELPAQLKGDPGQKGDGISVDGASFHAPVSVDFSRPQYIAYASPIPRIAIIGSPTSCVIDDAGYLSVEKIYNDGTARIILPEFTFDEGIFTYSFRRLSNMVFELADGDFNRYAIWSAGGETIHFGFIDKNNAVTQLAISPLPLGSDGNPDVLMNVELARGLVASGHLLEIRVWPEGSARPDTASMVYDHSHANDPLITNCTISISQLTAGVPAQLRAVKLVKHARATGQGYFKGLWFNRFASGYPLMATIRGGNSVRSRVTGTTSISLNYQVGAGQSQPPVLDIWINGVPTGNYVVLDYQNAGQNRVLVVDGLDENQIYNVELRIRGIHEFDPKFALGCGVLIESFVGSSASARFEPWADTRPRIGFFGDSITEGIVARGNEAGLNPITSGGDNNWCARFAEALGLQDIRSAFGGSGITQNGNGNAPKYFDPALGLGHELDQSALFHYMNGREIEWREVGLKYAVFNHGTNDQASVADFKAAYKASVVAFLAQNPEIVTVFLMRPFVEDILPRYAQAISDIVVELADPRLRYIDTTNWIRPIDPETGKSPDLTDGAHPNMIGMNTITNKLLEEMGGAGVPVRYQ